MNNSATPLIALIALLCGCASHRAVPAVDGPRPDAPSHSYAQARTWVEAHCRSNDVPEATRIFVVFDGRPQFAAEIVKYHEGITIDEILRQTAFAHSAYDVRVFRTFLEHGGTTWKPASPYGQEYFFRPLDLLWVRDRDYHDDIGIVL